MEGITIKKIKPAFTDARGSITDVLNEKVNHVGLVITKKDAIRANHYHKLSTQYSYILSGSAEVSVAKFDKASRVEKFILNSGDLVTISPLIIHKFKAIEDFIMIDVISESRAGTGYEDDVIRVTLE